MFLSTSLPLLFFIYFYFQTLNCSQKYYSQKFNNSTLKTKLLTFSVICVIQQVSSNGCCSSHCFGQKRQSVICRNVLWRWRIVSLRRSQRIHQKQLFRSLSTKHLALTHKKLMFLLILIYKFHVLNTKFNKYRTSF